MTKAANTKHSDKIARLCWCVSQRAERREPRAQQRRGIDRRQGVWDRHKPACFRDHHFGIAAVMMNAGIFLVPAAHEIAFAAELAIATRAGEKPDTHALTDYPALDAGTKCIDAADELMAWNAWPIDRKQSFYCPGIRVADPARLDANSHLARFRSLQRLFRQLQTAAADRLHCAIGRSGFHQAPPLVDLSVAVPAITKSIGIPLSLKTPPQLGREEKGGFGTRISGAYWSRMKARTSWRNTSSSSEKLRCRSPLLDPRS